MLFQGDLHQPCILMAAGTLFRLHPEVHFMPITLSSKRHTHPAERRSSCVECAQIVSAESKGREMTGLLVAGANEKCIKHLVSSVRP